MNPLLILTICAVIYTGVFIWALIKFYKLGKDQLYVSKGKYKLDKDLLLASQEQYKLNKDLLLVSQEKYKLDKYMLLVSLNQVFFDEPEFQKLLDNIDRGDGLTVDDLRIASRCLDYFEPFYHLIETNCLSIDQVDDMFAFRFFAIVNDQDVQDELIGPHSDYYNNIVNLYSMWDKYRKDNGKPTMYESTEMSGQKWYKEMTGSAI